MGEIRIVGPGKTRGYPYPVCKKEFSCIPDKDIHDIHVCKKEFSCIPDKDNTCFTWTDNSYLTHVISPRTG